MESANGRSYCELVRDHYLAHWGRKMCEIQFHKGPIAELPREFRILRFEPSATREMWTYASLCMSQPGDDARLELHLFAGEEHDDLVELLVATAHYHRTGRRLGLGHTINFGRAWIRGSQCDHGLISLPYLDGPSLEHLRTNETAIRFLWLIPVTESEAEFCRTRGIEAIERRFEATRFKYSDPARDPVV